MFRRYIDGDNNFLISKIIDKRNKFGYIKESDTTGLISLFNIHIERIYDNLLLYFNSDLLNNVYPEVYKNLVSILYSYIDMGFSVSKFNMCFEIAADEIIRKSLGRRSVDIFSSDYLLSKGNFSDIGKFILLNNFSSIIVGSNNPYFIKDNMEFVCSECGISKLKYKNELKKISKEILNISNESEKVLNKKR